MPLPVLGRSRALARATVGVAATCVVATTLAVGPSTSLSADASTPAQTPAQTPTRVHQHFGHHQLSRTARARFALTRAEEALSPSTPAAERPDATLALRKLWLLRSSLPRSERAQADSLSQRPSSDSVDCSSAIACVHWTAGTVAPTWPATVRDVINYVGTTYRAAGYKATLPDGTLGGGPQTDIYITDLPPGLYGYCTTDQQTATRPGDYAVWAFCVLDNDYAGFPRTPLENLEVTAAHEFYHATQFAYDYMEDPWLLESTAVTMEDELYTDVNDNLQYLKVSPITRPQESMDDFDRSDLLYYGVWNFWRYLIEKYPATTGTLPTLLLRIFEYADSSRGRRKNLYSTQAIDKALRKLDHTTLAKQFALYSDATRRTRSVFSEGKANHYPIKKLAGRATLSGKGATQQFSTRLDHLTSATYRFSSSGLDDKAKLRLNLDLARRFTGSEAVVSVYKVDGSVKTHWVRLKRNGHAGKRYKFGSGKVSAIEVTLVNASTRYRNCFKKQTPYSCSGTPMDQHEADAVRGTVIG